MPPTAKTHPNQPELRAFALGKLPPPEAATIEAHLTECDECTQHLVATPDDTMVQLAREAATQSFRAAPGDTAAVRAAESATPTELIDHPRYKLRGLLGTGGMGAVFKAEHRLMERFVALKIIRRSFTASPQAAERFRREVRAAAKLAHPNIVTAFDAEQAGDLHFLVMEYVEGVSLDRLVAQQGTLTSAQACNLIRQAALGLAHAHDKGMIHRDIKPQNLMVTRQGQLKILDFGLARLATETAGDLRDANEPADAARTTAGMLLGTPDYVAPEQVRDASGVDARCDIYSLGCTLYFLLTGHPPFPQGTAYDKLASHASRTPEPVQDQRDDVPAEVAAILDQMMAKNPAERFASSGDVAKALQPYIKSTSSPAAKVAAAPVVPAAPMPPAEQPVVHSTVALPPVAVIAAAPIKGKEPPSTSLFLAIGGGALALVVALALAWPLLWPGDDRPETPPTGTIPRSPTGRVLFVVPSKEAWYADYGPVKERLEAAGLRVTTAAETRGRCIPGRDPNWPSPPPIMADVAVSEALPASDYDAILFAGYQISPYINVGPSRDAVARLLADFHKEGKVIGAVCCGQAVLAHHHLLDGQQAAGGEVLRKSFPYDVPGGPAWTERAVQTADSGLLITARDDQSAVAFANAVVLALGR